MTTLLRNQHYKVQKHSGYASATCPRPEVRATAEAPQLTKVPDREEQGKPGNDTRRGRCHLLESVYGPCG